MICVGGVQGSSTNDSICFVILGDMITKIPQNMLYDALDVFQQEVIVAQVKIETIAMTGNGCSHGFKKNNLTVNRKTGH